VRVLSPKKSEAHMENQGTLKSLFVPGGLLLLGAAILLHAGFPAISPAAVDFYYYSVFGAGIVLAWRFHSSRVLFALIVLLLAQRALVFFSAGRVVSVGPGRIAFEAIAFLLPINFIILSLVRERGLSIPSALPRLLLLFLESTFVAILCRPGETSSPVLLHVALLNRSLFHWTRIPQLALLGFAGALGFLLFRFLLYRKPVEAGLLWSLAATLLGLQASGLGRVATAYWATAGLLLLASIIENSYVLAYHDELTLLPGRRAFNEALLRLEAPYAVAAVDIDHFKNFNDTYGHDTGDQVLRLVATRLARVTTGGQAFRVGGEEFSILFPGKSMKEVAPHLESLRILIEESKFRIRGMPERRSAPRGTGRRVADKKHKSRQSRLSNFSSESSPNELSVTVSIGIAEPTTKTQEIEQVIQASDKALYRAKKAGRNRVETTSEPRSRQRQKRNIA
jgi:diguanylate cyclase (GGDEF)-like protein